MPITIAPVALQNITANTDYNLPITITDNPDTVEVKGLLQGFHYTYEDSTLTITGRTQRLVTNATWSITAKKRSETVSSQITYNVVPPAPIIATVPKQYIVRGVPYELSVPIENNPSEVKSEGHLIGLKYTGTNPHKISGTVPTDAKFTVDSGEFIINAKNGGGVHTQNIDWELARTLYAVDSTDNRVYIFHNATPDGEVAEAIRTFYLRNNPTATGAAIDGNDLYIYNKTNYEVSIVPAGTQNNTFATATRKFTLNSVNIHAGGFTVDENNVYLIDNNGIIRLYDKTTANNQSANPIRSLDPFENASIFEGLTHDDTYLYIAHRDTTLNQYVISVIDKDTTDAMPSIERTFQVPFTTGFPNGLAVWKNDLYCVSSSGRIYIFPKDTADGAIAVASRTFNTPTSADSIRGIAIS